MSATLVGKNAALVGNNSPGKICRNIISQEN